MNITTALEIEKLPPVKEGLIVCIDEKNKKYAMIPLDKCKLLVKDKYIELGRYLEEIKENNTKLKESFLSFQEELIPKFNNLVNEFKMYVITTSIKNIGGK